MVFSSGIFVRVEKRCNISSFARKLLLTNTKNKKPSKDRNPEGYKPKPTAYEKVFK
jgi:hypothetical protein